MSELDLGVTVVCDVQLYERLRQDSGLKNNRVGKAYAKAVLWPKKLADIRGHVGDMADVMADVRVTVENGEIRLSDEEQEKATTTAVRTFSNMKNGQSVRASLPKWIASHFQADFLGLVLVPVSPVQIQKAFNTIATDDAEDQYPLWLTKTLPDMEDLVCRQLRSDAQLVWVKRKAWHSLSAALDCAGIDLVPQEDKTDRKRIELLELGDIKGKARRSHEQLVMSGIGQALRSVWLIVEVEEICRTNSQRYGEMPIVKDDYAGFLSTLDMYQVLDLNRELEERIATATQWADLEALESLVCWLTWWRVPESVDWLHELQQAHQAEQTDICLALNSNEAAEMVAASEAGQVGAYQQGPHGKLLPAYQLRINPHRTGLGLDGGQQAAEDIKNSLLAGYYAGDPNQQVKALHSVEIERRLLSQRDSDSASMQRFRQADDWVRAAKQAGRRFWMSSKDINQLNVDERAGLSSIFQQADVFQFSGKHAEHSEELIIQYLRVVKGVIDANPQQPASARNF